MARHLTFNPNMEDDLLGDGWACSVRRAWKEMQRRDPELCGIPHAYSVWQWAQCELAGMPGRCVASPQCVALATGEAVPLDRLEELLALSDIVIHETCNPPIGGKPFYECKATYDLREQWALDHVKLHAQLSFVMPYVHGHLLMRSKKLRTAVERAKSTVEKRFKKYCEQAL